MAKEQSSGRAFWWTLLGGIIATGLLSRMVETGVRLFDKYLGDALYAAMIYVLVRLTGRIERVTLWSAVALIVIECFQLTQIPAHLLGSEYLVVRVSARLLGTHFSVLDLLAYAAGIGCMVAVDRSITRLGKGGTHQAPAALSNGAPGAGSNNRQREPGA